MDARARDVVESLVNKDVTDASDFLWQSQVSFNTIYAG